MQIVGFLMRRLKYKYFFCRAGKVIQERDAAEEIIIEGLFTINSLPSGAISVSAHLVMPSSGIEGQIDWSAATIKSASAICALLLLNVTEENHNLTMSIKVPFDQGRIELIYSVYGTEQGDIMIKRDVTGLIEVSDEELDHLNAEAGGSGTLLINGDLNVVTIYSV